MSDNRVGAEEAPVSSGPPRPPFVLSVGVTGHRVDVLPEGSIPALQSRIADVLNLIEDAGAELFYMESACFAGDPQKLRFVSPIADGADQIAAEVALERGWELQAVLPFQRGEYRETLANAAAKERFDRLIERATCVLELPGELGNAVDAYVMTGRATVAHCDMLIAVWDGLPPRGRGGTAEVVQLALTRGTAVIHIPPEPDARTRVLWAAFDPTVVTVMDEPTVERPLDGDDVDIMLRGLLLPPPDQQEKHFLDRFFKERLNRVRARLEYQLLLMTAGVRRLKARDFNVNYADRMNHEEWEQYRQQCAAAHHIDPPIEVLEDAYCWADRLATYLAQTYRSGHIFAFVMGGVAVCMGLSAFMAPHFKLQWAAAEMFITIAVILNAYIGSRSEWHRRWLDYRQLAERLRPMRSLKLLGIAAPDPPGTATNPIPLRWIDWYAAGIWRAMGCPSGAIDRETAARLATAIADHEVAPQMSYHERNAHQIELLDHRLEQIGTALFFATLVVSIITLVGLTLGSSFVNDWGNWFTLVSAGFPALATAVFGIRFQGDFGGDAIRSMATADTLRQIDSELRGNANLTRAADLTEQAARTMLSDLDEWRLVNQQRDLSVG